MTLERAMFVLESAQERSAVKVNVQAVKSWMVVLETVESFMGDGVTKS